MSERIGILGSGLVGQALAKGFREFGYTVRVGSRKGGAVENWDGEIGKFEDVAAWADLIVLAVKGSAALKVLDAAKGKLDAKTVMDTTNPIAEEAPEDGVLKYFTGPNESLMEQLQAAAPEAHFVKAFSSVGNAYMVKPNFPNGPPTMFICGNDEEAKQAATKILKDFGWEVADMGSAKAARAIEPLCILWCIPGLLRNEWSQAFKLLKT